MLKKRNSKWQLAKLLIAFGLIAGQLLTLYPAEQASASSEFGTSVSVSSSTAQPGDSVTLTTAVASNLTRSIHAQVKVSDSNGTTAFEQWLYNVPTTAGQTTEHPVEWIVPEGIPAGKYSVSVGIFGANWDTMYNWDSGLAYVTIQSDSASPSFTSTLNAPAAVEAGNSARITANLVSSLASNANVSLSVFSPSNVKVHEESVANQTFAANQIKPIATEWEVPADADNGTYRIQLTVSDPTGAAIYYQNANLGNIRVAKVDPAASASYVTKATTGTARVKAGEIAQYTAKITADRNVSVLIDIVVKNPYTNEAVEQTVLQHQALTAGATLEVPLSWYVPADAATGNYPIEIGIFGEQWEGPYHWNSAAGAIQVTDGTTQSITFTSSAEVARSPIKAGANQSFTIEAASDANTKANVKLKVIDPKGAVVHLKDFANETFTAQQQKRLQTDWIVPGNAEPGTYLVDTAITSIDGTVVYDSQWSAAQFVVEQDDTPPPTQPDNGATANWTTSVTVAESVEAGYPIAITANVVSDDYAHALVDVEIFGEQGQAYQYFVDDLYFQPNAPKQIPVTWNIPAAQPRGDYTVKIGVFPAGWKSVWDHDWNDNAGTFEVNWGIIPEIAQSSSVSSDTVQPGQTETIQTQLTSSETVPASVRLEILDSAGNRVAQRDYAEEQFVQGVANGYELDWTPPANAVNGTYKLKVSVMKPDGVRVFYANADAAQFELTGGIDLEYTLSAATIQSEVSAGRTLNVNVRAGSTVPSVVSLKANFIDSLTGETVHSEWLDNQILPEGEEAALSLDWTLPKWIRMNEQKVRSGAEPLIKYVLDGDYRIDLELYNSDKSYLILSQEGAAVFKVASPVDAPAPQPAQEPALPEIMKLGVFATNNDAYGLTGWMPETGLPWNFAYRYLNGGVNNADGWTGWDQYNVGDWQGAYAYDYAKEATDRGYTPVLTFYQMLQSISGDCLDCDETKDDIITLSDPYAMRAYLEEFKLLMQLLGTGNYNGRQGIGKTAIVHVDPDLAGYAQQAVLDNNRCYGKCTGQGNDPSFLKAAVASTRMPELADLPNTYQGFNWALLRLRDLYAPNVLMAPHVNSWGTLIDVGRDTNPDLDVTALGKLAGDFANLSGVQTVPEGIKPYDYIFNDIDDDDAGGPRGYWLDRTNLTLPNFARWEQFVKAASEQTGKKVMVWQIPVGNQVYRAMDNTPGHYQDNKVEYFFSHLQQLADAGIVGLMFGHGQPGSTSHYDRMDDNQNAPAEEDYYNPEPLTNSDGWGDGSMHTNDKLADYTDDDGGYLRLQAKQYYENPLPVSNH